LHKNDLVKKNKNSYKPCAFLHLQKKFQKNHNETWNLRNLPKLPIVLNRDFDPLWNKNLGLLEAPICKTQKA
jgi:hypothetical protein